MNKNELEKLKNMQEDASLYPRVLVHKDGGAGGHLAIYFFYFHRFSGDGGGGGDGAGIGVGCDRSIFWDDPLLTDSSILVFIEKA